MTTNIFHFWIKILAAGLVVANIRGGAFAQKAHLDKSSPIIGAGINILAYNNILSTPSLPTFGEQDMDNIKIAGFKSVRINLQQYSNYIHDGRVDPLWLASITRYIKMAEIRNISVVVDYHDINGLCAKSFGPCSENLDLIWTALSLEFKGTYSAKLVFEPLNEPHAPMTVDQWNRYVTHIVGLIKGIDKNRWIAIDPMDYASPSALPELAIPTKDKIMVDVHYYKPQSFTMQFKSSSRYQGWGSSDDILSMKSDVSAISAWSSKNSIPVFIGEYSAWDTVPLNDRVAYLSNLSNFANRMGIAHIYWQYEHDFRAFDRKSGTWNFPILRSIAGSSGNNSSD